MAGKKFCCPICGSDQYTFKRGSNGVMGPRAASWVEYCQCSGCSVRFGDPDKFTKQAEEETKDGAGSQVG